MSRILNGLAVGLSIVACGLALYAVVTRPAAQVESIGSSEAAAEDVAVKKNETGSAVVSGGDPLLRNRVDRLADRIGALEARPAVPIPTATALPPKNAPYPAPEPVDLRPIGSHLKALEKRVDKIASEMQKPLAASLAADDAAKEVVTGIVEEQLDKFRQERRERRQAMGDQVTDEIVNEFANKAGLSDEQFSALYPALGELRQGMRENFRAMRRGEKDFADVRTAAKEARATFDEKARATLTDEQFKMYEKEMNDRFGGPGGLFK
jgi:hypothetical protein